METEARPSRLKLGSKKKPSPRMMSFVDHLSELRYRIIVSIIAVSVGAVVAFVLYDPIIKFLLEPYCDSVSRGQSCKLIQLSPLDGFALRLRIAAFGGVLLASPVLFYQLWRFATPALKQNERKYAFPFVVSSVLLFVFGGVIAWLTFPAALNFLQGVGGDRLLVAYAPGPYIRLITLMFLAFGLAFEFPLFLVALQLVGVVTPQQLAKSRRYSAVGITAFAAIITPSQDPISLFTMAVPMYIFFELAIFIGKVTQRK